jgi:hypothetical protein
MPKKRGPGRPKMEGTGTLIGVRCHQKFLEAVDRWCKQQEVPPSRPAAIRRLAEIGLETSRGRR